MCDMAVQLSTCFLEDSKMTPLPAGALDLLHGATGHMGWPVGPQPDYLLGSLPLLPTTHTVLAFCRSWSGLAAY